MDATEASVAARDHFAVITGDHPLGFSVEAASRDSTSDRWMVACSLWDYFGAPRRSQYVLYVDLSGRIDSVARQ